MFSYEREVRIVLSRTEEQDENDSKLVTLNSSPIGHTIEWNPEEHLDSIWVHPEADGAFMETVVGVVEQYAPKLKQHVTASAMTEVPPI